MLTFLPFRTLRLVILYVSYPTAEKTYARGNFVTYLVFSAYFCTVVGVLSVENE